MFLRYPVEHRPATPEYVLAMFRDAHRLQCQFDPEADPSVTLGNTTTIAEWRAACDLGEWRDLARHLEAEWQVSISDELWHSILEPASDKRIGGVCQAIAQRATRPMPRPVQLGGLKCETAGTFLTIRYLLSEGGADVEGLTPSSRLAPYTRKFPMVFLGPVSRIAPLTLPIVVQRSRLYFGSLWVLTVSSLVLAASLWFPLLGLIVVGACGFGLGLAGAEVGARRSEAVIDTDGVPTFRDLAVLVLGGSRIGVDDVGAGI